MLSMAQHALADIPSPKAGRMTFAFDDQGRALLLKPDRNTIFLTPGAAVVPDYLDVHWFADLQALGNAGVQFPQQPGIARIWLDINGRLYALLNNGGILNISTSGPQGVPGTNGLPGPANTLAIGTVGTLAAGAAATATITGAAPNQTLNLGIPQGAAGANGTNGLSGPANTLTIGTVGTVGPGAAATASITGAAPNQTLNLGIPQGAAGVTPTPRLIGTMNPYAISTTFNLAAPGGTPALPALSAAFDAWVVFTCLTANAGMSPGDSFRCALAVGIGAGQVPFYLARLAAGTWQLRTMATVPRLVNMVNGTETAITVTSWRADVYAAY